MSQAQQVAIIDTSTHQGRRATVNLGQNCVGANAGKLLADTDGGHLQPRPILDDDDDSATFSFATSDLELGTYHLVVDCGQDVTVSSEVMVFRQNGAERGGANSVVLLTSVGFGSTVALFGLPALVAPANASSLTRPRSTRRTQRRP